MPDNHNENRERQLGSKQPTGGCAISQDRCEEFSMQPAAEHAITMASAKARVKPEEKD